MKILFSLLLMISFSLSLTSCQVAENVVISQQKLDDSVMRVYDKDGLTFSYPDNWKITRDETYRELGRVVAVEDSKHGIFIVSLFPLEVSLSLEEYAKEVEREWKSRAANIDVQSKEITRDVLLRPTEGMRLKFRFNTIPHTNDLFLIRDKKKIAVFSIQNTDENWENTDKAFQIIFDTLRFE